MPHASPPSGSLTRLRRKISRSTGTLRHHLYQFQDYRRTHGLNAALRHSLYMARLLLGQARLNRKLASRNRARGPVTARAAGGGKLSIVFLSGEPATPGHKYRIDCLRACLPGQTYAVECVRFGIDDLESALLQDPRPDLLWIWRLPMTDAVSGLLGELKASGTRIHYDVDDLMINPDLAQTKLIDGIRSMGLREEEVRNFYRRHLDMLLFADHASAPTHPLCAQMLYFQPQVWMVPNTFTADDLVKSRKARRQKKPDGLFRMGYASGSRTHQKDFAGILPGICSILAKFPQARLVVYPMTLLLEEYPELAAFEAQIEKRDMVPVEDLVYEYALYDVNLCPLEAGNVFCECKSQLKFFEAALCGTPTVASPTDPFARYIRHGINGFLAETPEEWAHCLESLLTRPELGPALGKAARRSVLWTFSPEHLRQSVESVLHASLSPVPSAQPDAWALRRMVQAHSHEQIALPETTTLFEAHRHAEARITVVIPCYNYAHFLEEALNSVRDQSLEALDLVVVDDVSTDNSLETALRWMQANQDRFGTVRLLQNRQNSRLAQSRNAAVDHAETEFYFPLDPDNFLDPDCLRLLLEQADDTRRGFVYPRLASVGNARLMPAPRDWNIHTLRNGNYIDAMALVRKSVWVCVGGYRHDARIIGWEDFEFWCKCAEQAIEGALCRDAVAFYRAHEASMLATITDQPDFLPTAKAAMRELHPWLVLP